MENKKLHNKIKTLFNKGLAYKDIAKSVGISPSKAFSIVKELNLSRDKFTKWDEKIRELSERGLTYEKIGKKLKISSGRVAIIGKKLNLKSVKNQKIDEKIKELFEKGFLYGDISKELGMSKTAVSGRVKHLGLCRYKFKKEFYLELIKKIERDFEQGLSYEEIKKKHCLTKHLNQGLHRFGLKLYATHRQRRNSEIVDRYKKQIAKKILVSNDKKIKDPRKIVTLSSIYTISTENKFKKYPNIGSRFHGGIFLPKKILNIIKRKREVENKTFSEIAEFLNSKNHLTATGVPFSNHNVRFKYKAIKKNKL